MNNRYRRQIAFSRVGESGQVQLQSARVAICGMGALGAMVAERLCRMGIGYLRLLDRDWVELDNLPRQALYTTQDAIDVRPKSIAAAEHLHRINPGVECESFVEDITFENAEDRLADVDCIVDGTDNFETRFLINEVAWKHSLPWVHAGVIGAAGQWMTFVPNKTPCFRCLMPEVPPIEQMQTCDLNGVLGAAVGVIASWQAMEVVKLILDLDSAADSQLRVLDLWKGTVRNVRVPQESDCRVCARKKFEFLSGDSGALARVLCGRGAVQIQSARRERVDLRSLADRLRLAGNVFESPFLIRFQAPPHTVCVFADGRTVIQGTENPDEARKIYSKWIGS
jgi:molybdopterin-synthase adenylyltransferase